MVKSALGVPSLARLELWKRNEIFEEASFPHSNVTYPLLVYLYRGIVFWLVLLMVLPIIGSSTNRLISGQYCIIYFFDLYVFFLTLVSIDFCGVGIDIVFDTVSTLNSVYWNRLNRKYILITVRRIIHAYSLSIYLRVSPPPHLPLLLPGQTRILFKDFRLNILHVRYTLNVIVKRLDSSLRNIKGVAQNDNYDDLCERYKTALEKRKYIVDIKYKCCLSYTQPTCIPYFTSNTSRIVNCFIFDLTLEKKTTHTCAYIYDTFFCFVLFSMNCFTITKNEIRRKQFK